MEKRKILHFPIAILELVLLRYLALRIRKPGKLPISKLLNLQTLIVRPIHTGIWGMYSLPNGIWKLSQLRHLHCWCMYLDSPQLASQNEVKNLILENLQTVYGLRPSCCTMEIFEGNKKVKKLEIAGEAQEFKSETGWHNNLKYLEELEALKVTVSLYCDFDYPPCLINPSPSSFPPYLKKLKLSRTCLQWNYMNIFSKLPNLEVLELKNGAFSGDQWEITTEIGFPILKFLLLEDLLLIYWTAIDDCFQCLERVYINNNNNYPV